MPLDVLGQEGLDRLHVIAGVHGVLCLVQPTEDRLCVLWVHSVGRRNREGMPVGFRNSASAVRSPTRENEARQATDPPASARNRGTDFSHPTGSASCSARNSQSTWRSL